MDSALAPLPVLPPSPSSLPTEIHPRNGQLRPIGAILNEVLRHYDLPLPDGEQEEPDK